MRGCRSSVPFVFLASLQELARGSAGKGGSSPDDQHVLIICVDGLPAYLLNDLAALLATVRRLREERGPRRRG